MVSHSLDFDLLNRPLEISSVTSLDVSESPHGARSHHYPVVTFHIHTLFCCNLLLLFCSPAVVNNFMHWLKSHTLLLSLQQWPNVTSKQRGLVNNILLCLSLIIKYVSQMFSALFPTGFFTQHYFLPFPSSQLCLECTHTK